MTQDQVNRGLKFGVIFSILWLAGLGSLYALIQGLKFRKAISQSDGNLVGIGKAWWCIIVGGLGFSFWLVVIAVGTWNQFGYSG
jgi:hypothetical protein